jgi:hypothetical protein
MPLSLRIPSKKEEMIKKSYWILIFTATMLKGCLKQLILWLPMENSSICPQWFSENSILGL